MEPVPAESILLLEQPTGREERVNLIFRISILPQLPFLGQDHARNFGFRGLVGLTLDKVVFQEDVQSVMIQFPVVNLCPGRVLIGEERENALIARNVLLKSGHQIPHQVPQLVNEISTMDASLQTRVGLHVMLLSRNVFELLLVHDGREAAVDARVLLIELELVIAHDHESEEGME